MHKKLKYLFRKGKSPLAAALRCVLSPLRGTPPQRPRYCHTDSIFLTENQYFYIYGIALAIPNPCDIPYIPLMREITNCLKDCSFIISSKLFEIQVKVFLKKSLYSFIIEFSKNGISKF